MADELNVWLSVVSSGDGNIVTERLKCSGGWMVRCVNDTDKTMAMEFSPDPVGDWNPTSTDDD